MNQIQQEEYERMLREQQLQVSDERTKNMQQEMYLGQENQSMIKEQLDLTEELDRIDYLLRGYSLEKDDTTGERKWVKPKDNEMVILSEYGVHLIRNTITWYLNKNTLLSNYDDTTILKKMKDFATDLTDTIFMEYEKVFQYPTFDECKGVLKDRIRNKTNIKVFAKELMGKEISEKEKELIENKIVKDMEPIIEKELEKIKQQIIKNKLKRFLILIREIQDAVHSTYNRAYGGQERKTLREHIHISETKGNMSSPVQQQQGGLLSFFKR